MVIGLKRGRHLDERHSCPAGNPRGLPIEISLDRHTPHVTHVALWPPFIQAPLGQSRTPLHSEEKIRKQPGVD